MPNSFLPDLHILLGSRSPQRLMLLQQLVTAEQITVCPPASHEEAGFGGLHDWQAIEAQLRNIARQKCRDVIEQVQNQKDSYPEKKPVVLTADTIIVAESQTNLIVLGQPPEPDWKETVRRWFQNDLIGKTHRAATAICLMDFHGSLRERVVVTEVTFSADSGKLLDWYLSTEDPRGKAGGYGIQGAGSLFVSQVKGSLSNVIGLPLRDVWEMFEEYRIKTR